MPTVQTHKSLKPRPTESSKKAKSPAETARCATPDNGRSSFSSIREGDSGLKQTFTLSRISSLAIDPEAIDDAASVITEDGEFAAPLTKPGSRLHGVWFPIGELRNWKQIDVRGRKRSRSFEDISCRYKAWECCNLPETQTKSEVGGSPIENLPPECLASIIELLVVDIPPHGTNKRNADILALLATSRTLYHNTLGVLYKHATFPHSRIFRKFLANITEHPSLGEMVRRLDFSHFNPSTIFFTASERAQTKNLTAETLSRCLDLTPNLQEFLAQEYVEDDLGPEVLSRLFLGLPRLQAVDLAGCSATPFKNAFSAILLASWPRQLSIRRLSLHKCISLTPTVLETVLARMGRATHLDLAGTRVTDAALASIPHTAMLSHLNLARCKALTAPSVLDFIANHPAAKSLVYLSLSQDAASHELLDAEDVTQLLPLLPKTLRSLSLKGARMDPSHMELLKSLMQHLEELAVGRETPIKAIQEHLKQGKHSVRYLDLSDLADTDLDLRDTFNDPSSLLRKTSLPLEVIELSAGPYHLLKRHAATLETFKWQAQEVGSRYWLVRKEGLEDGYRWWKMGAESWGMRKIPVARADVGGMYGSFMFGRKL